MQKQFDLTINLPHWIGQCLITMSTDDLREPTNFITWLIYVEAKRRGMLNLSPLKPHETNLSTADLGERNVIEPD